MIRRCFYARLTTAQLYWTEIKSIMMECCCLKFYRRIELTQWLPSNVQGHARSNCICKLEKRKKKDIQNEDRPL